MATITKVGWVIKAKVNGRVKWVSGIFATEAGAKDYLALYLRSFPKSEACIASVSSE